MTCATTGEAMGARCPADRGVDAIPLRRSPDATKISEPNPNLPTTPCRNQRPRTPLETPARQHALGYLQSAVHVKPSTPSSGPATSTRHRVLPGVTSLARAGEQLPNRLRERRCGRCLVGTPCDRWCSTFEPPTALVGIGENTSQIPFVRRAQTLALPGARGPRDVEGRPSGERRFVGVDRVLTGRAAHCNAVRDGRRSVT